MARAHETCDHGHDAPVDMLRALPGNQGFPGRHQCPTCAYVAGIQRISAGSTDIVTCQHGNRAPRDVIIPLPGTQAGAGRHKCATCAYVQGLAKAGERLAPSEGADGGDDAVAIGFARDSEAAKRIGDAGEEFVVREEKKKLVEAGRADLASQVVHSSKEVGDGLGYDVESRTSDGAILHLEVKTTTGKRETGFLITRNELNFGRANPRTFALVRVYEFDEDRREGELDYLYGSPDDHFLLEPTEFRASPRME